MDHNRKPYPLDAAIIVRLTPELRRAAKLAGHRRNMTTSALVRALLIREITGHAWEDGTFAPGELCSMVSGDTEGAK